jgi:hypothetical protein
MADGAPNGYSVMTFDQDGYKLDFRAAGRSADDQIGIRMPAQILSQTTSQTDVWVNVYNGSEKSITKMKVDDAENWIELQRERAIDPYFQRLWELEQQLSPPDEPTLTKPKSSTHIWRGRLLVGLEPGLHVLHVQSTDMHGRTYSAKQPFRIVAVPEVQPATVSGK